MVRSASFLVGIISILLTCSTDLPESGYIIEVVFLVIERGSQVFECLNNTLCSVEEVVHIAT